MGICPVTRATPWLSTPEEVPPVKMLDLLLLAAVALLTAAGWLVVPSLGLAAAGAGCGAAWFLLGEG